MFLINDNTEKLWSVITLIKIQKQNIGRINDLVSKVSFPTQFAFSRPKEPQSINACISGDTQTQLWPLQKKNRGSIYN